MSGRHHTQHNDTPLRLSVTTFSITGKKCETQHNDIQQNGSAVMLTVVVAIITMVNVTFNPFKLSAVMLSAFMPGAIILSVFMVNVIMLGVVAPLSV